MLVKLLHSQKQLYPNDVILSGRVMLVKLLQPLKQSFPNDVILSGRVMLVKLLHFQYLLLVDYQYHTL